MSKGSERAKQELKSKMPTPPISNDMFKQLNEKMALNFNSFQKFYDGQFKKVQQEFQNVFDSMRKALTTLSDENLQVKLQFHSVLKLLIDKKTITSEEVREAQDFLLEQDRINAEKRVDAKLNLKDVTRPVQLKDYVRINLDGFIDEKSIFPQPIEGMLLIVGSNTLKEIESQLVGMSTGEKKDVEIEFAKDHEVEMFRDKKVLFKIEVTKVKEKQEETKKE